MRNIIVSIIITMLLLCSNSEAFDGNRKGFVLGIGGGIAKFYNTNHFDYAIVVPHSLGYGLNQQNSLMWTGTQNFYKIENQNVSYGYSEFSWYHYYSKNDNSFFSTIGITKFVMVNIYFGGGYTITKNIQIGIFYRELFDDDLLNDLKITITYVAF